MNDLKDVLERIANALEKIANNLTEKSAQNIVKNNNTEINLENKSEILINENKAFLNDYSEIEDFLNSKNISIKNIPDETEIDETLDKIAFFMGQRYSHINKIYKLIKSNLNTGRTFRLDLKNQPQEQISSITQLCNNLSQIAFLEAYKYYRSPTYILYAKVNRIPKALNFFSGGWLERFIKKAIIESIHKNSFPVPINFSYLKNPQILLPNGDDFELDLLFKIESEIFWFEAKTGDYQKYISKYSKMANILELDNNHSFMILTDITETAASALHSLFNMTVIKIDDFYQFFFDIIKNFKQEVSDNSIQIEENVQNGI